MNIPSSAVVRNAVASTLLAAALPLQVFAADAPAAAASKPAGPTAEAKIASKCKAMSGDEQRACIADTRKATESRKAAESRRHASHRAKPHAHAASSAT